MTGAEAIVTGVFTVSNNRVDVEMRLFDAVQGRFIMGKKYSGTLDEHRLICHRFANEVLRELTGATRHIRDRHCFRHAHRREQGAVLL